ncbi:MAG: galactokinase [Pseudomonadota bacterium]
MKPTDRQVAMCDALTSVFSSQFGDADRLGFVIAPGRVNLLGEHTDHNDGFVLPMTVDRGVYVASRERKDDRIRVYSRRFDESIDYRLSRPPATVPGDWRCYVVGVIEELRQRGFMDRGVDAVIDGDLDLGAGLSSSAALEVAVAMAMEQLGGFEIGAVETASLCQTVEHRYAEVLCGIMDQFASRLGRPGHALHLDCRSLEYRHVPLSLGAYRIVVVESGVSRALADSAYNERRADCRRALDYFKTVDPGIGALRDVTPELLAEHERSLDNASFRRCRHVITENRRVEQAIDYLERGDLEAFGCLVSASHQSLAQDYAVSCPELDWLVATANATDGVLGSRMTGAGFGGCTVSIAHVEAVDALAARIGSGYADRFGRQARIFVLEANIEAGSIL